MTNSRVKVFPDWLNSGTFEAAGNFPNRYFKDLTAHALLLVAATVSVIPCLKGSVLINWIGYNNTDFLIKFHDSKSWACKSPPVYWTCHTSEIPQMLDKMPHVNQRRHKYCDAECNSFSSSRMSFLFLPPNTSRETWLLSGLRTPWCTTKVEGPKGLWNLQQKELVSHCIMFASGKPIC